jgi:hypothetical protein
MTRGRDAKTYYDSADNWDSPTWVEVKKIIDETITPSAELASGGSREDEYVDNEIASRSFEWNCTYRYRSGDDTVYSALLAAYVAGDPIYMSFMDKDIAVDGAKGWKVPILIDQMPQQKNLGDLKEVTVHGVGKLVISDSTIYKATALTISSTTTTTTTAET